MIERGGDPAKALNHRWEVDMDFCDKSHKMNSPDLRIKNSELNHRGRYEGTFILKGLEGLP